MVVTHKTRTLLLGSENRDHFHCDNVSFNIGMWAEDDWSPGTRARAVLKTVYWIRSRPSSIHLRAFHRGF